MSSDLAPMRPLLSVNKKLKDSKHAWNERRAQAFKENKSTKNIVKVIILTQIDRHEYNVMHAKLDFAQAWSKTIIVIGIQ